MKLTIASRGSQLALWQAHWVEGRLTDLGHECRIEIIKTTGDKFTDAPLAKARSRYRRQGSLHQGDRGSAARWPRRSRGAQP